MKLGGRSKAFVGGLVSVLVVAMVLSYSRGASHSVDSSLPTTSDTGGQGLAGLFQTLRQQNVPTVSLRQRLDELDEALDSATGNVLVMTLPGPVPMRDGERSELVEWIERGNTLVPKTTLRDRPRWRRALAGSNDAEALINALGLRFDGETSKSEEGPLVTLRRRALTLAGAHSIPALDGIERVRTRRFKDRIADWTAFPIDDSIEVKTALLDSSNQTPALQYAPIGDGALWVSTYPELFSNAVVLHEHNLDLFAAIVNTSLNDGAVVFDDFRFGLSALYDAAAFYRDSRFHTTLLALGALWLLWLVGRNPRLAPVRQRPHRPDVAELVRSTGNLYARRLAPREAGTALVSHFEKSARRQLRLAPDAALWDHLNEKLGAGNSALKELQRHVRQLHSGGTPSLSKLSHAIDGVNTSLKGN